MQATDSIRRRLVLLVAGLVAWSATDAGAQSTTFTLTSGQVTKDNFVTPGPSNNLGNFDYGGTGALGVAAPGSAKGRFDSVMTFDVGPAIEFFDFQYGADSWDLLELRLEMTVVGANNAIFNANSPGLINVGYLPIDAWIEGTGSPMSPGTSGLTFNTLGMVTAGEELLTSLNVTGVATGSVIAFDLPLLTDFTDDVLAGGLTSFHLSSSSGALLFGSRSNPVGTNTPRLYITAQAAAIPEPSSLIFAGIGSAASWFGYRRRRRLLASLQPE